MELAVTVDCMEPFVKATYNLEGDGFLALEVYERLSALYIAITSKHMPNVKAMAKAEAGGNSLREQQLLDYAEVCVTPAYDYFKAKFDHDLKPALMAFKSARFFSPSKIYTIRPSPSDINDLSVLPDYLAQAEDVSPSVDPIVWWRDHAHKLPHWSQACKFITLIQPSSAAAERVFSLLANSFNNNQESALEDYIQTSVMLQYNHR